MAAIVVSDKLSFDGIIVKVQRGMETWDTRLVTGTVAAGKGLK